MVVDAFMFFNEIDILEGRLEYLYEHVDYFVIVESNITHSGDSKPLYYLNNAKRYKKYLNKIIYYPFITSKDQYDFSRKPEHERDYETGPWRVENAQRNYISSALEIFDDNDIVIISDVDEIPHKDCIPIAKDYLGRGWEVLAIQQEFYCYNFNQKLPWAWHGSVITTNSYAKKFGAQHLRNIKHTIPVISNGGWHLSYWGTVEDIQNKIKSFAHQELNNDRFLDSNYIKTKISKGEDLYRENSPFVPADRSCINQDIINIFGKFENKTLDLAK